MNQQKTLTLSDVISKMKSVSPDDIALITKAHDFAMDAHKDLKRFSGEPYFVHLIGTAYNLAELGMGPITVAAGFLHDSIEDVPVPAETIQREFGSEILFLVEGVTKLGKIRYKGSERHNESLRKLFIATSQDIRVLIIKLADRLHNIGTLQFVRPEKQVRIATETLQIYAPIAYRLGIRKLSRQLEDLSFPYVYPEEYRKVKDLLKEKKNETEKSLSKFQKNLHKELAKNDYRDVSIQYRIKGLFSLWWKLQKKGNDIEKIYDINAVRVIVPTVADCYQVLGLVHTVWRPLPGRIKDYIAFPKPNGYRSIHTTIFVGDGTIVEIQIKTKEMYEEGEYGIASHISYKEGGHSKSKTNFHWIQQLLSRIPITTKDQPQSSTVTPKWIKDLVEYQKHNLDNDSYQHNLQGDYLKERIFVFTPRGDVVDLPIDSTPIDFAYTIHSDIGNHTVGAKINGKYSTLSEKLKNGEIVEIESRKNGKPNIKWLDFVKTTIAQRHIRNYFELPARPSKKSKSPKKAKLKRKIIQIKTIIFIFLYFFM